MNVVKSIKNQAFLLWVLSKKLINKPNIPYKGIFIEQ